MPLTDAEEDFLEKFKIFCLTIKDDRYDEIDFHDFSIGFFIAIGVSNLDKASRLAHTARNTYKYWM